MCRLLLLNLGLLLGTATFGQKLLTSPGLTSHFYFHYENDLFARTDRYYTQGIDLGINHFSQKTNECNELKRLTFSQNVFTPSTIKSDSVLVNDQPYAATLSGNVELGMIRSNVFSYLVGGEIGMIGPLAGGKQMQTGIHKATKNFLPLGWQYQINNGLIADVYAKVEKPVLSIDSVFQLIGGVSARLGTFQTNVIPSFSIVIGNRKSGSVSFFLENTLAAVAYDGTLQGALICSKSDYVLRSNEVEDFVFKSELSLLYRIRKVALMLNYSVQSKTFDYQGSDFHYWGGLRLIYHY